MKRLSTVERLGTTVDRKYVLMALLGTGGMGAVYRAKHLVTGREVALKSSRSSTVGTPQLAERFAVEARLTAALRHPNIIDVLDAGTDELGFPYVVFELLRGECVEDLLNRRGTLDPLDAGTICVGVLQGLVAVHATGVVHRDIKPENVFLDRQPSGERTVRLLDFGISKLVLPPGGALRGLTTPGQVLGTPKYMAPEQVAAERDVDGRQTCGPLG